LLLHCLLLTYHHSPKHTGDISSVFINRNKKSTRSIKYRAVSQYRRYGLNRACSECQNAAV
jgi:hypothetical protein